MHIWYAIMFSYFVVQIHRQSIYGLLFIVTWRCLFAVNVLRSQSHTSNDP